MRSQINHQAHANNLNLGESDICIKNNAVTVKAGEQLEIWSVHCEETREGKGGEQDKIYRIYFIYNTKIISKYLKT